MLWGVMTLLGCDDTLGYADDVWYDDGCGVMMMLWGTLCCEVDHGAATGDETPLGGYSVTEAHDDGVGLRR
ncbi:hypothetical protein NDU88_006804 [Pleurodeles waltl]|uniref:Secreted protein n=1 Tax=Pleurodeles waltl TaxID=8319 RepID=A0AAV7N432_PLEWA|nr:hypothetical protein NDU88_006804 [Pleurodeles waltl]